MHHRYTSIGVALVFSLAGCDSLSAPPPGGMTGTWVLRSVAGSPLPALVSDASNLLVLSDTLRFGLHYPAIYTGPIVYSSRRVGVTGGPPSESGGLYLLEQDGDLIVLRIVCPPNADCLVDERRGKVEGLTMILEYTPLDFGPPLRSPLVYERVR